MPGLPAGSPAWCAGSPGPRRASASWRLACRRSATRASPKAGPSGARRRADAPASAWSNRSAPAGDHLPYPPVAGAMAASRFEGTTQLVLFQAHRAQPGVERPARVRETASPRLANRTPSLVSAGRVPLSTINQRPGRQNDGYPAALPGLPGIPRGCSRNRYAGFVCALPVTGWVNPGRWKWVSLTQEMMGQVSIGEGVIPHVGQGPD